MTSTREVRTSSSARFLFTNTWSWKIYGWRAIYASIHFWWPGAEEQLARGRGKPRNEPVQPVSALSFATSGH